MSQHSSPPPTPPANGPTGLDAYKPAEIFRLIEASGVAKTSLPFVSLLALGCLAGAFIAFGALFFLAVLTGADASFGPVRMLAGVAFSLGLILVIIGGAELFTGNALLVMAWVDRRVTTPALLRNWTIVYAANFAGAVGMAVLVWLAGLGSGPIGQTAAKIAMQKAALPALELMTRGILCNALVCLAVWLSFAARDAASKVLVIIFPITAFVALGLEHSVANMFLLPFAMLSGAQISIGDIAYNLLLVTIGNIIGGSGGVALSYRTAYHGLTPR
ncbi:MAG: formate/nitrite transporter family protein [Beijerinckiaceae bacterium]